MFFWIVTVVYALYYLLLGSLSVLLGPFLSSVYLGADALVGKVFAYTTGAIELAFVAMCVASITLHVKRSAHAAKMWLITLGAVAIYEAALGVFLVTGTWEITDLLWPAITIYVFLRVLATSRQRTVAT